MNRVAITGIGVVAPGAVGIDAFRRLLRGGVSGVQPVERFDTEGLSAHSAGLVRDFVPKQFIAPMKMRRMNMLSRLAVSAAHMAMLDAGAAVTTESGVVLGTSFGPVQTSVEYMHEYVAKGAALAPPQLFAESVANAPGSHIAIETGFRGFNVTVTQRESSAMAAAMYAASQVVKGTVPAALLGGVEEVNEMIFSVLDRIGALAHVNGVAVEPARPFDRLRNGLSIGEGSAVLLSESAQLARDRARIYGWLAGFGIGRDTTASISNWGEGHAQVAATMRAAIDDAELTLDDIDAVYASANGTRRCDRLEYRALQTLFGSRLPPVVAAKGYFGEYAAGGALQLVAALLALDEQSLHASLGFEEGDAEMTIDVTREARPMTLRNVLVSSLSAGGGIVCAVISREDG